MEMDLWYYYCILWVSIRSLFMEKLLHSLEIEKDAL